jgi:hypothetical protein
MNEFTHSQQNQCPGCIDAECAWAWVQLVAEVALEGDEDAIETLPNVVAHALDVQRVELLS